MMIDYLKHFIKITLNEIFENELKLNPNNNSYINEFKNYGIIESDANFGLNISKPDDLIEKFKKRFNISTQTLSFGEILTKNKKKVIFLNDDNAVTQIFYPQDFLVSFRSSSFCTSYHEDIINKILSKKKIDFNFRDNNGNNLLHYAINSQNYLAIKKIISEIADLENLKESTNNEGNSAIGLCDKKIEKINEYFKDDNLNIFAKMSSYFDEEIKNQIENIDSHKNILKNSDMISYLSLLLNFFKQLKF